MHKKWEALISLADYLVLGAFEAATRGVSTNDFGDCAPGECTISIPFTSGRKTCANPDVGKSQNLPEGHDLSAPRRVLMNEFQLTEKEMVALLGGKTEHSYSSYCFSELHLYFSHHLMLCVLQEVTAWGVVTAVCLVSMALGIIIQTT